MANSLYDFASRLAKSLGIRFVAALVRTAEAPEQKLMANSSMQARNVADAIDTIEQIPARRQQAAYQTRRDSVSKFV